MTGFYQLAVFFSRESNPFCSLKIFFLWAVLHLTPAVKPQDILREFRATPAGRDATHNGVRVNDRIVVVNGDKSQVYFGRGGGRAEPG